MPCHICWPSQKYVKDHFINCNTLNSFFPSTHAMHISDHPKSLLHAIRMKYHIIDKLHRNAKALDIISEWHFQPKWYLISWTFFHFQDRGQKSLTGVSIDCLPLRDFILNRSRNWIPQQHSTMNISVAQIDTEEAKFQQKIDQEFATNLEIEGNVYFRWRFAPNLNHKFSNCNSMLWCSQFPHLIDSRSGLKTLLMPNVTFVFSESNILGGRGGEVWGTSPV